MSKNRHDRWVKIGQLRKSYGREGALRCFVETVFEYQFLQDKYVYVDLKGDMVPYFFTKRDGEDRHYMIQFDDVKTPEGAKELAGLDIYFLKSELLPETHSAISQSEANAPERLIGWTLIDKRTQLKYVIANIEEFPQQTMLTVNSDQGQHYVPLVEEWILNINENNNSVEFSLPEGLIE